MLQNTYDGMVDVDKVMATYVAGLLLESPDTSSEDRGLYIAIRKKPFNKFKKILKSRKRRKRKGN